MERGAALVMILLYDDLIRNELLFQRPILISFFRESVKTGGDAPRRGVGEALF